MFDCDICGCLVVSLLGRVGLCICMPVGVKKKKKKKSFLSHLDLALCQFGLLSDIFVRGCSSPSALAVAQSLLVTHCLKET